MRNAAERVHRVLISMGMRTEGHTPAEVTKLCEDIVDLARKHGLRPETAAVRYAMDRAVSGASERMDRVIEPARRPD